MALNLREFTLLLIIIKFFRKYLKNNTMKNVMYGAAVLFYTFYFVGNNNL